jgi:hypothetical protein
MKTTTYFFRFFLLSFLVVSTFACTESKNSKSYNASIASTGKVSLPQEEARFLFTVHNLALFNTHLATEAQIRSTSLESVALAENILHTNNKMIADISSVAEEYGLELPADITDAQKMEWREVVKQKGWAFDKKFALVMEENLKSLHKLVKDASTTLKNEAIAKLSSDALTALKTQGELAIVQQEK